MADMSTWFQDAHHGATNEGDLSSMAEVPIHPDALPDGTPTLVSGDPTGDAVFNHQQGDNLYGFQGDCGLVSVQDVLNQFGVPVSESDVLQHALDYGECNVSDDPLQAGGTSPAEQMQLFSDYGIPAHIEEEGTINSLASHVQVGCGVIIEVNAGILWNDPGAYEQGQANHAIVVTGVARDPQTGQVQGFFVNDSGDGQSAKFVDANTMQAAWVDTGGECVVTNYQHV